MSNLKKDMLIYLKGKPKIIPAVQFNKYFSDNEHSFILHRPSEDGPAVCYPDGREDYYENGLRHRIDGPAVVCPNGFFGWYFLGNAHRENKPALTWPDGGYEWYLHGKKHRLTGPAIFHPGFHVMNEWWIYGEQYTSKKWREIRKTIR